MARSTTSTHEGFRICLVILTIAIGACRSNQARRVPGSQVAEDARQAGPKAMYVRAEGAGATDGSSWLNAMGGLPATLERGAVYWVAAGEYGNYTFDDPLRDDSAITVRKATATEHGNAEGWNPEYAVGQAVFGSLRFETGHYTLDGGELNGLRVVGQMGSEAAIQIDGRHIRLRHLEVDGGFRKGEGKQTAGTCNGVNINADHVLLDHCDIHNIADDGVGIYANHVKLLHSDIHDLDGCGTDGDCGPCYNGHSDGIELSGAADVELIGNLIYDVRSNAALFMDDWSGSAVRDLLVFNNVFYTPDSGFAVYLQKLSGAKVHNNVIWGKTQGNRYGGLSMGQGIEGLQMFNNIILNINYSHMNGSFVSEKHALDFNLFGMINTDEYSPNPHDSIGNPRFSGIPMSSDPRDHKRVGVRRDDFRPRASQAIDTGTAAVGVPPRDLNGTARPQGGAWDRGPFESLPR
jgi:hypothetical protein